MNANHTSSGNQATGIELDSRGIERDYYTRDKSRDILCSTKSRVRALVIVVIALIILAVAGYHSEAAKIAEWEETGVWQW